jgi:predicted regulator of Ras-like GTPase activity (Roadblock/LC7/MglB family)
MSSPFLALLESLARQRGVQGSMIVSERDGIVVDAHVQIGVRTTTVAALAGSI